MSNGLASYFDEMYREINKSNTEEYWNIIMEIARKALVGIRGIMVKQLSEETMKRLLEEGFTVNVLEKGSIIIYF